MRISACWLVCFVFLAGCSLARVNEGPRPGFAHITLARQPSGESAILVFEIESRHRFISQPLSRALWDPSTIDLRPGHYVLEIECRRPDAGVVVDGGIDFEVSVRADETYVLDCAPSWTHGYAENNFALTKQ